MLKKRYINILFYIAFIIVTGILVRLTINLTQLLNEAGSFEAIIDSFNSLQKLIATVNIVCYFILLTIGFWAFVVQKKITFVLLSLIQYVAITLYNSVNLNQALFILKGLNPKEETGYWLLVFLGVFYIIGAVVIAVIGYIAVKNYSKRNKKALGITD